MVQNWVGCVSGVHVGTGFICYKHGLDAGKDGWTRREWIWTLQAMCLSWLNCFQLLIAVLEMMASEASLLGFKVNWQKTKVQAMGTRVNVPSTVTVQGQQTAVVDKFLGSLIHSSTQSTPRHHTPQRYQSCSDAKSRNHFCKSYVNFGDQPDSLSQQCWSFITLVSYQSFYMRIWMLGNHQGGCTQDWCCWSVVLENDAWNQMAPICSQWWGDEDN